MQINDLTVIDNFLSKVQSYMETRMQLGETDGLNILHDASLIIEILSNHCMTYGIGIPVQEIFNIVKSEKK